jgi:hypothetical protein
VSADCRRASQDNAERQSSEAGINHCCRTSPSPQFGTSAMSSGGRAPVCYLTA